MTNFATGDRGQRYEVRCRYAPGEPKKTFGWSDDMDGVHAMLRSISLHPTMCDGEYEDREPF